MSKRLMNNELMGLIFELLFRGVSSCGAYARDKSNHMTLMKFKIVFFAPHEKSSHGFARGAETKTSLSLVIT